jgi:hypothetical protein
MEDFISIFDHKEGDPRNISGSGNHFRTTVWLDARDKASLRSGSQALKASPKPMILAVNEFSNFFNVRSSNVNLIPGMHTSLRIKQVQHVTTESFRALALGTRQCRLLDENPGKAHVVPLLQQEPLLSDQTFYFQMKIACLNTTLKSPATSSVFSTWPLNRRTVCHGIIQCHLLNSHLPYLSALQVRIPTISWSSLMLL